LHGSTPEAALVAVGMTIAACVGLGSAWTAAGVWVGVGSLTWSLI